MWTGGTKTCRSRRTRALPRWWVEALRLLREDQRREQGGSWTTSGLVFAWSAGAELDASNVLGAFRVVISDAEGLNPAEWTPRELRHSFVSLLSNTACRLRRSPRLVGNSSTTVFRKRIRPVLQAGAVAMDRIFEGRAEP